MHRRIVILGTGTGVGKTRVSVRLTEALASADAQAIVLAVKPVETGYDPEGASDARDLLAASRLEPCSAVTVGPRSVAHARPNPLGVIPPRYVFAEPISAHLAARRARTRISIAAIRGWVDSLEQRYMRGHTRSYMVIETAGGVFSPLGPRLTNFDLARALDPALWVLVAPDALGVLHDVRATLTAMGRRSADHIVLSQSRPPDASTGTNAAELTCVGLPRPSAVLERNGSADCMRALVRGITRERRGPSRSGSSARQRAPRSPRSG